MIIFESILTTFNRNCQALDRIEFYNLLQKIFKLIGLLAKKGQLHQPCQISDYATVWDVSFYKQIGKKNYDV
jgi:hypothetical protein